MKITMITTPPRQDERRMRGKGPGFNTDRKKPTSK